ncbi:class I SAM-dependent methyltransferase [Deltaproteobacteria bacterium TL4]
MKLFDRACPVCHSTETSKVLLDAHFDFEQLDPFAFASRKIPEYMHFRMVCCPTCDLLYATPAPTEEGLGAEYEQAAYDSTVEAAYAAKTYAHYLKQVLKNLSHVESALDIGTGNGAFLKYLKAHFKQVEGIEPSLAPIEAALPEIRPLIKHGLFDAQNFKNESFSLITCFQTIEHVFQPERLCREIHSLLKPGGAVMFIAHNYRSLLARILGSKTPIYDIEHMQLNSPQSLHYLLRQTGFQHIRIFSVTNRYPLNYWVKLLPIALSVKKKLISLLDTLHLGSIPIPMKVGNLGAFGYKQSELIATEEGEETQSKRL